MESRKITISLNGMLAIKLSDGTYADLRGAKAKALVALLATAPRFTRSRTWLQDMLWSDRGREQRSASLRQCISELKAALSSDSDALFADRQKVSFASECIEIAETDPEQGEFLEGLRVRDRAFQAWLEEQRAKFHVNYPSSPAHNPVDDRLVVFICESDEQHDCLALEDAFQQSLMKSVSEQSFVKFGKFRTLDITGNCIVVSAKAHRIPGGLKLVVIVEDIRARAIVWSGNCPLLETDDPWARNPRFLGMVNQVLDSVARAHLAKIPSNRIGGDKDANLLGEIAVRNLFSIKKADVANAIELLQLAYSLEPRGAYMGWIAQALTIQYVERFVKIDQELRERAKEACRLALTNEPNNSNVLACVANTRANIERDFIAASELARQAVRANPVNPLSWYAASSAALCRGSLEDGYNFATIAQRLADGTRMKFWTDCQLSIAAAMLGKGPEALKFGESASALAPEFRPPLRYLTALYALSADHENARHTFARLAAKEEVSIDQMVADPEYPIGMMRRYCRRLTGALSEAEI